MRRTPGRLRATVVGLTGTFLLGTAGCDPHPTEPAPGAVTLPLSAVTQIQDLLAEKDARTPAQKKVSSQLLYLRSGRFTPPPSGAPFSPPADAAPGVPAATGASTVRSLATTDGAGRVLVDIKTTAGADVTTRVEGLGGTVVDVSAPHNSARAWLALGQLEALAADATVLAIRPALQAQTWRADPARGGAKFAGGTRAERVEAVRRAVQKSLATPAPGKAGAAAVSPAGAAAASRRGIAISEGSRAHGADRARKFYDVDGTGVKVGVLADSDDFLEQSIATGDLPADTVTLDGQSGRPGTGEGTAMMQIVHDVAPGAKLFFATALNSAESFAENIRALRFVHRCDVIVDDILYYFESPFQDDIIADAVNDVTKDGALYFSAAGNTGNYDDGTSGVWEGDFVAGGTLSTLPAPYVVHDFGNKVISNRVETFGGPLMVHWSDPGTLDNPISSNDYDVFVLGPDLRDVAAAATDVQDGTGLPLETLAFGIPQGFRIVIAKHPNAKPRALRLAVVGGELGLSTPGSIYGHAAAADAFAVAAVDAFAASGGEFFAGPTTPVQLYSADGNRRIFYDNRGRPIAGGVTFASGGGTLRQKPEIAAADGVSTTLPPESRLNPFFGTSAAAPHAAAIAALMRSAVPGIRPAKVRQALQSGALDIEGKGWDRDSGAGIASAMNAIRDAGGKPTVFIEVATVTATPVGSDDLVPGGSATLQIALVNNGGAAATAVKAQLTSTTPGATITQGMSAYPNLAPGATGTNATAFAFQLAPSVPCGTRVALALTVTFVGAGTSPRTAAFTMQTGRPATVPTRFSYTGPVAPIPDGDLLGVNVPLVVAGLPTISRLSFRFDGDMCTDAFGAETVGLDHSYDGDLIIRLTAPSGISQTLMDRPGGFLNSGNNFCQTVLDDAATFPIGAVSQLDAPYVGTYLPTSPQDVFIGDVGDGTWTLNVTDVASGDLGNVRAFSLDITGYDCASP